MGNLNKFKKVNAKFTIEVETDFVDDDSIDESYIKYLIEQDLQDKGWTNIKSIEIEFFEVKRKE
ncbi:MAG: hypothetical protein FH762_18050 [Firmicutes bacterium]|nr:hypothetical protein [Bacillota bacterium]